MSTHLTAVIHIKLINVDTIEKIANTAVNFSTYIMTSLVVSFFVIGVTRSRTIV